VEGKARPMLFYPAMKRLTLDLAAIVPRRRDRPGVVHLRAFATWWRPSRDPKRCPARRWPAASG
jgi:hypothetical protein